MARKRERERRSCERGRKLAGGGTPTTLSSDRTAGIHAMTVTPPIRPVMNYPSFPSPPSLSLSLPPLSFLLRDDADRC